MPRKRDARQGPDGVAVVDKASGWTSHDVVAKARGLLQTRKIGHAGTLDPDATGVLVLGVGAATRLLRYCSALPKTYVGEIVFGVATSTLDAAGDVTAEVDMRHLSADAVRQATERFVGDIEQVPPMVSAVKVGGRRLHELAREGKEVERAARPVTVHRFDVEAIQPTDAGHPVYRCHVECSSGTYIRTLAADLGEALGGVAHLRALRRTAIGPFTLDVARPLESLDASALLPVAAAVSGLVPVTVDAELAALVRNGRVLDAATLGVDTDAGGGAGPWAVHGPGGELLAVYEAHGRGRVKPEMVLAAPPDAGGGVGEKGQSSSSVAADADPA
jgi:tRNA pseudouridine55 synthase